MPWRGPEYEGEQPTGGWQILDWITEYLPVPEGASAGEPLTLTREQAQFFLNFYKIDPLFEGPAIRGRGLVNARQVLRAILMRSKGWGKSPILGAACLVEGLAPVVPDGWDAYGEPVMRPWNSLGFKARVQVLAVSEDQTGNTWDPILDMARGSENLVADYGLNVMETFISGDRVRIEYATSAGDSREGGRPVFAVLDQTESWHQGNGGVKLAAAVRRNLTKTQGSSIESPNAFSPGDKSVAERSSKACDAQAKRAQRDPTYRPTILLDHRGAPESVDIYDPESLKDGLAYAYGDSADVNGGWVNLDRVVEDFWDPDSTVEDSRRFFLNQLLERADAWISPLELAAIKDTSKEVKQGEAITLGFDGSRGRQRGVTDATALIACRVSDGHLFEPLPVSVWEQPSKWDKRTMWAPPVDEIVAAVGQVFRQYRVIGFYADPAQWESYVAGWEAAYGKRLLAKSSAAHPIQWWMTGNRASLTVKALEVLRQAVIQEEISYDGGLYLTSHVINARMVTSRVGVQIAKQHPDSAEKIDAAVAAMLAYRCRLDAIAAGANRPKKRPAKIQRIR